MFIVLRVDLQSSCIKQWRLSSKLTWLKFTFSIITSLLRSILHRVWFLSVSWNPSQNTKTTALLLINQPTCSNRRGGQSRGACLMESEDPCARSQPLRCKRLHARGFHRWDPLPREVCPDTRCLCPSRTARLSALGPRVCEALGCPWGDGAISIQAVSVTPSAQPSLLLYIFCIWCGWAAGTGLTPIV